MYILSLLLFMSTILETWLNNTYRSLLRNMWAWDKKFFKDFFPALLQNKTSIMSKLHLDSCKNKAEVGIRNSNFLWKESFAGFPRKVENRCFKLVWKITDEDYICIDEVDIAKPKAQKMEWINRVRDGSTGNIVTGYIFHGVSIDGIPVILQREDLVNRTKNDYFWEIIMRIKKHSRWKWTLVLDALYDTKSYMSFLQDKNMNFIIRAKRERILYNKSWAVLWKMKDFCEWVHEIYLKQADHSLTRIYLYVREFPGYKTPMRIYSNTADRDVLEYKRRWDIECIFKTMKQEYKLEKIQASSLQVIENIVATIQMAVAFAHHLYWIQHQHKWKTFFQCNLGLQNRFKIYTKWQGYTINRNAYIWFISYTIQTMYQWRKKKRKRHFTPQPLCEAQMCLF